MTAQALERITYKGEDLGLVTEPLNDFLDKNYSKENYPFTFPHTGLWRGYIAQWHIKENRLYISNLEAYLNEDREVVGLQFLFPNEIEVFAEWFTGELRIVKGDRIEFVRKAFAFHYEWDILVEVKNGQVISERTIDNRKNGK